MRATPHCLLLVLLLGAPLTAHAAPSPNLTVEHPLKPPDTSSPRATLWSLRSILERVQDTADHPTQSSEIAALERRVLRLLDLSELPLEFAEDRGLEAALMIKEVLDRIELPALEEIPGTEEVARARQDADLGRLLELLRADAGTAELRATLKPEIERWTLPDTEITIGLVRDGPREGEFLFTPDTVDRAAEFYERVRELPYKSHATTPGLFEAYRTTPGHGLRLQGSEFFPDWSKRVVGGQTIWQWTAAAVALAITAAAILVLPRWGRRWDVGRAASEGPVDPYATTWRVGRMLAILAAIGLTRAAKWLLDEVVNITGAVLEAISYVLVAVDVVLLSWLAVLALTQAGELVIHWRGFGPRGARAQLVRLTTQLLALGLIVGIAAYSANQIGVPAYSVLTGLGIGGLAVALAAQETLKDLFGSLVVMSDRPYSVGDWVVVGDNEGTVEAIGYRSTRIRTFYDSLLSIPNAEMVSQPIDNMGRRGYRRIKTFLPIRDDTPPERVEALLEGIKRIIQANPTTRKDYFHVVLHDFGASGLKIMLYLFVKVPTWGEELVERQRIFLEVLRLAEALDVALAPNQVIEAFRASAPAAPGGDVGADALRRIADDFGPDGGAARPRGSSIFVPPHEE